MRDLSDIMDVKFLVTGYLNLSFLRNWNSESISDFVCKVSDRSEKDLRIDTRKKQVLKLLDLTDSQNLTQKVTEGTRKTNVLLNDNENLLFVIEHQKHEKLMDHDMLLLKLRDMKTKNKKVEIKNNFSSILIPEYITKNLTTDQIRKAKEFLRENKWVGVTVFCFQYLCLFVCEAECGI